MQWCVTKSIWMLGENPSYTSIFRRWCSHLMDEGKASSQNLVTIIPRVVDTIQAPPMVI